MKLKICKFGIFFVTLQAEKILSKTIGKIKVVHIAGRMVVYFEDTNKKVWLHKIVEVANDSRNCNTDRVAILDFAASIKKSNVLPIHIVTYACLIQYLKELGFEVQQGKTNVEVADYIYGGLLKKKPIYTQIE